MLTIRAAETIRETEIHMAMRNTGKRERFHGIVGNGETCALVSPRGDVDWMCIPRFDGGSVFGRLIDARGGFFRVNAAGADFTDWQQGYRPDTAILETECVGAGGAVALRMTDWMPWGRRELRRLLTPGEGGAVAEATIAPAFDYRRAAHTWRRETESASGTRMLRFSAEAAGQRLDVMAPEEAVVGSQKHGDGALTLALRLDGPVEIVLAYGDAGEWEEPVFGAESLLEAEERFWRGWLGKSTYRGAYEDAFRRSLIAMKLMTYARTGACLAAGTTSIPQHLGSGSNWDYRFTWVRDGSYTASSYMEAGYAEEAKAFLDFIFSVARTDGSKPWQPLYRIDGDADCREEILAHLSGFLGDGPVRIGNLAYAQKQTDVEGEALDALWDVYKHTKDRDFLAKHWAAVRAVADYVAGHWGETDNGIWELRGVIGHYTHSKVMCWTALDRAAGVADALGELTKRDAWRAAAGAVKSDILRRGWNGRMGTFTLAYDIPMGDTCLLAIPLTGMLAPWDPKVRSMAARFERELVYEGLAGRNIFEPTPFLLVTYWLARYYAVAGQVGKARAVVERTLGAMTDLGYFCEHAISAEDVPKPGVGTMLRSGIDLLTAHRSFGSAMRFAESLRNFYAARSGFKKKTDTPRVTAEEARMFKGNFPQVYSHEELVRLLLCMGI